MARVITRINGRPLRFELQPTTPDLSEPENSAKLEVNVILTTFENAAAALRAAGNLARRLSARIRILAPYVVPMQLSVERPPVSTAFLENRLVGLARTCEEAFEVRADLMLCRDARRCILQALGPNSVVVLGSKKRWRANRERRLAKALTSEGHHVILVESR